MKIKGITRYAVTCVTLACSSAYAYEPVDYVNTLMGTDSRMELSTGNTYPSVSVPWGMNAWTPMTGKRGSGWAYCYDDTHITGLKLTHQPSPWINDYGQLILMPFTGPAENDLQETASWFSHKAEQATPYYYSVYLADFDIRANLAPTNRAAIMSIDYRNADDAALVIDAFDKDGVINLSPDHRRITGYTTNNHGGVPDNFKMHFIIEFDKPWCDSIVQTASIKALEFGKTSVLNARIASSFISLEQAERNIKELGNRTIAEVATDGRKAWNNVLGRLEATDSNIDRLRTFYSCLYRAVLFPRSFYELDVNGNPVHYSPYNGKVLPGCMFTDTGVWDTFRSLFPLLNLVYPDMSAKMQEGFANAYRESGFLPEWASPGHRDCMVGNNSASVVADALLSGVADKDAEVLWEAVKHGTEAVHPQIRSTGRLGHEYYNTIGYVPYDKGINESAARTLEYAYDDWCIYQMGKALGKGKGEIDKYAMRAYNYMNLFDKETNLMRGRNADGSMMSPFNPFKWGDAFTEGNAWHYTWSVFHDPSGLAKLMGGEQKMAEMLDSVFIVPPVFDESYYGFVIHEIREMQIMDRGNYAHGNQPIQHMIYLYNWTPEPWKAQKWTRDVMDHFYTPTPDGSCGDEDNGQTSAWYVFSAMGFYPVCPGTLQYPLGSPLLDELKINFPNGKQALITKQGDGCYIDNLTVNGTDYGKNYITLPMLRDGGKLEFMMSEMPNTQRGIHASDRPYSFSIDEPSVAAR